jgi:membrane protease YdiL (CAAX protease family)
MSDYLDYARRGRNAWWLYLLAGLLGAGGGVAVSGVIGGALVLGRAVPKQMVLDLMQPSHPVNFFLGNGVVFAVLLAAFALAIRLVQAKRFGDIVGDWRWGRFAAGFGLWSLCLAAMTLADLMLRPGGFRWSANGQTPALAVAALFGLGVQTFTEEFVFRGWLTQGLLLATKRPLPAALISGVLFGALHIPNGVPQWANATLFGVVAALIAIRTGGLAFTFGLHLINNLFGAVVVVSAGDVFHGAPGLFTQTTPGLMWWDVIAGVALLAVPAVFVLGRWPAPALQRFE